MPSIRNAQRLVDRVRQLGAGSERVKILLNRASDQHLIAPKQIETALGYGIHHTFTERLPDGVDGAQLRRAADADQPLRDRVAVRQLHAHLVGMPAEEAKPEPEKQARRSWASSNGNRQP